MNARVFKKEDGFYAVIEGVETNLYFRIPPEFDEYIDIEIRSGFIVAENNGIGIAVNSWV